MVDLILIGSEISFLLYEAILTRIYLDNSYLVRSTLGDGIGKPRFGRFF